MQFINWQPETPEQRRAREQYEYDLLIEQMRHKIHSPLKVNDPVDKIENGIPVAPVPGDPGNGGDGTTGGDGGDGGTGSGKRKKLPIELPAGTTTSTP